MKKISVALTFDEAQALLKLAENQLFRVRHIDPKIPGYIVAPEQLEVADSAVQILANAVKTARPLKAGTATVAHR